ncbi:hypothetical protein M3B11_02760 [Brevibacterium sp. p3-SID960]|uniref:hypothetical protein n=1 Tax=Brevibacterium sp. p3-SID960 TaxID=2916063 RepID=UPI0021A914CD|nr:hypothetical protein [Brevibacterium sp. p3-SID960]MCT1689889.1 hypothetical protein [Brevibacterium sp. p3-SID960]
MSESQHQQEQRLVREDMRRVRAAAAQVLVPADERATTEPHVPEQAALSVAVDLYMVAFTMKPGVRAAGICIADEAAARMGLNPQHVHDFALEMLASVDAQSRSDDE